MALKQKGGGQGAPDLPVQEKRLAAIIGQTSISGILTGNDGESDDIQQERHLR